MYVYTSVTCALSSHKHQLQCHTCACRLETQTDSTGVRQLKWLVYVSPFAAYLFWKLRMTVIKVDAEHLKSHYKGQVRRMPLASRVTSCRCIHVCGLAYMLTADA